MSKFLTAKVAVATLTAVLAIGGVAAATTVAKNASEHGKAKAVRDLGKAENANGPDATGPAKDGLCRAWAAGKGGENGGKADSTAFQALVTAAGGEDKVEAFCATSTTGADASAADSTGGKGAEERASGPDATGKSKSGMCKAWAAGSEAESSEARRDRMGAAAFEALVEAAGGEANISTYCAAEVTTGQPSDNAAQDTRGEQGAEQRAPASETDHGAGSGQGDESEDTSNG